MFDRRGECISPSRLVFLLFKQACEEEFWDGRDSCVYVGTSFYVKQVWYI